MEHCFEVWFDKNPILLLEDNPSDVNLFQEALTELKINKELIVARNGEEGLDYLKSGKELPGIILADINMPKISGIEFLKIVKQHEVYRSIPVVILTSSASKSDRKAAFHWYAAGYMKKPADFNDFTDLIAVLMNYWTCSEWYYIPHTD